MAWDLGFRGYGARGHRKTVSSEELQEIQNKP